MKIENEILVNKYGQGIVDIEDLLIVFNSLESDEKKKFLNNMLFLIRQSRPADRDIELAIEQSKLRETFTPCVLLKKGVAAHYLKRLLDLPENELNKSFILLLSLFKIAYQRRFEEEKNFEGKWWYSDLSNDKIVETILEKYK
jgi:hypothetical protein